MNDEMKKKLIEYLDKTGSAVDSAGNFVLEQAPDVIQQYLVWEFYSNLILSIIAVLISIFFIRIYSICWKVGEEGKWDNPGPVLGLLIFGIMSIAFFFGSLERVYHMVKVSVAPKIVLIEKMSDLIKSNQ